MSGTRLYKASRLATSVETVVKNGRGVLGGLIVTAVGATGNRVRVFDGVDTGGTLLLDLNPPTLRELNMTVNMKTGVFVKIEGTTPPEVTVLFK